MQPLLAAGATAGQAGAGAGLAARARCSRAGPERRPGRPRRHSDADGSCHDYCRPAGLKGPVCSGNEPARSM